MSPEKILKIETNKDSIISEKNQKIIESISSSEEDISNVERRAEIKERIFYLMIRDKLGALIEKAVQNARYSKEETYIFNEVFGKLDEVEKDYLYSIPADLRDFTFGTLFKKHLGSEEVFISFMNKEWLPRLKEIGGQPGYHFSKYDIKEKKMKNRDQFTGVDTTWIIDGTEKDHRNDDLPMAYYSLDFQNAYRDKNPKYIYVIRAQTGAKGRHYRDAYGAWGRSSTLSIVDKYILKDIDEEVHAIYQELVKENSKKKAA